MVKTKQLMTMEVTVFIYIPPIISPVLSIGSRILSRI